MTRTEMLVFICNNPYIKITHELFTSDEYIYTKEDGNVYTEEGYLFEDWSVNSFNQGLRMRIGGYWENGWYLYDTN